jgi:hypothetical protein
MFMIEQEKATKMDDALTIQIQFPNGRTAGWHQSDQIKLVRTPGKVFVPIVPVAQNSGQRQYSQQPKACCRTHRRCVVGIRFLVMWHGLEAELLHQLSQGDSTQMRQFSQRLQPLGVELFDLIGETFQFPQLFRADGFGSALINQFIEPLLDGGRQPLIDLYQEFGLSFREAGRVLSNLEREEPGSESLQFFARHLQRGLQQLVSFNVDGWHNACSVCEETPMINYDGRHWPMK